MGIEELLALAIEEGASDLHLNLNSPPIIRIDGRLRYLDNWPNMQVEEIEEILRSIISEEQWKEFQTEQELDFAYSILHMGRFRVNALIQKGTISLAFRLIAHILSPLESLGLYAVYGELSLRPRGLVLVTGPTGSGKSTTLAAMINHINEVAKRH